MRNLIAQIIFNVDLDALIVERIERGRLYGMPFQKFAMALIELPKALIWPLTVDPKLRR